MRVNGHGHFYIPDDGTRVRVHDLAAALNVLCEQGKGEYGVMISTLEATAVLRYLREAAPDVLHENPHGVIHLAEETNEFWTAALHHQLPRE